MGSKSCECRERWPIRDHGCRRVSSREIRRIKIAIYFFILSIFFFWFGPSVYFRYITIFFCLHGFNKNK